ncbi:MAG: hypothetical protein ACQESG_04815 [Nanobdellota archaeon]
MKARTFIIISLLIVLILPSILSLGYQTYVTLEIREIPLDVTVMDGVALNTDQDALHMGGTVPGGGTKRKFRVSNTHDVPVEVTITHEDFPHRITMNPSQFRLEPNDSKQVEAHVTTTEDAPYGSYNTTVLVRIERIIGR